ncbi:MAG: hypothetical protein AAFR04_06675 [Pseudomonadota bacterium]
MTKMIALLALVALGAVALFDVLPDERMLWALTLPGVYLLGLMMLSND